MALTRTVNRLVVDTVQSYATFNLWDERTSTFRHFKLLAEYETDLDLVLGHLSAEDVLVGTEVVATSTSPVDVLQNAVLEATATYRADHAKINAIKAVREATGVGLKEAKDAIDKVWDLPVQRSY